MLEKRYRFHSRGGVRYTYQKGKTIRSSKFSLIFNKNERGFLRFSVVVSKKVIKSAVGRNRIRRRVYEAIRLTLPTLDLKSGDFIFVIFSPDVKDMDFKSLQKSLRSALFESKAKLLESPNEI